MKRLNPVRKDSVGLELMATLEEFKALRAGVAPELQTVMLEELKGWHGKICETQADGVNGPSRDCLIA